MQLLLGLFFFSILLTTGSSMQCEICENGSCSGTKVECPPETHVCMSVVFNNKENTAQITMKGCSPKDACKLFEDLIGKEPSTIIPDTPVGVVITEATCSKAPPSFASFFPAVLGLLLMKLLC
ncbi:putative Gamma type PLA2 inhibitor protein [Naja naja]|nr:putative Gamma type PLA2 inhibitor protein [Naja naja]